MKDQPILVLITAPGNNSARVIADRLVNERIAACVNILPGVVSIYTWQGEPSEDEEVMLIVKSTQELFADRLVPAVKEIHPYDVPEIIALPIILGSEDYLEWIAEMTGN
jgi:periplasmic divalent cation tolerance protein